MLTKYIIGIWLMPQDNLHMTTSELLSSCPGDQVEGMAATLEQKLSIEEIVNYTLTHRARLIRPVISYDATAFALSFALLPKRKAMRIPITICAGMFGTWYPNPIANLHPDTMFHLLI